MEIKLTPSQYILKKWTKEARSGIIHNVRGKEVKGYPKLVATHRYRQICPKLIQLAIEASSNQEAFLFLNKAVEEWSKQIMDICRRQDSVDIDICDIAINPSECMAQVKGFKKREGRKGRKRLKSWVETQSKRKKNASMTNVLQSQQSMVI